MPSQSPEIIHLLSTFAVAFSAPTSHASLSHASLSHASLATGATGATGFANVIVLVCGFRAKRERYYPGSRQTHRLLGLAGNGPLGWR